MGRRRGVEEGLRSDWHLALAKLVRGGGSEVRTLGRVLLREAPLGGNLGSTTRKPLSRRKRSAAPRPVRLLPSR